MARRNSRSSAPGAPRWTYVLVALVGAGGLLWTVTSNFILNSAPSPVQEPEPSTREATVHNVEGRSIGIVQGDVNINNGASAEEVEAIATNVAAIKQAVVQLSEGLKAKAHALHLTEQLFISLAKRIAENVPDIDQAYRELERVIEVAATEQAKGVLPANTDDAVEAIFREVDELNAKGEIDLAAKVIAEQVSRMDSNSLTLYNKGIAQAIITRDVDTAGDYELRKLPLVTPEPSAQFDALRRTGDAWYARGREKGLRFDLEVAIALARTTLERSQNTEQRRIAQNALGVALVALGSQESSPERLEEAVAVYRAAIVENSRERMPLDWAELQTSLGHALRTLGERESSPERLEEAVTAYRAALEEHTRERVPRDWARAQANLGNALAVLGRRESSSARLKGAVSSYRAALEEYTRDRVPLNWARTQSNLGNALAVLGELENSPERLEEAVIAHRAALEEYTRERLPRDWARTQHNLGYALVALGISESSSKRLKEAVTAYRAALEERTRERAPFNWAMTQFDLALAEQALADHPTTEIQYSHLEDALTHVNDALEIFNAKTTPFDYEKAIRLRDQLQERLTE